MKPRVSYMLVGAFVLLLGAALVAGIVWLSTAGGERSYETYVAYVSESVSGLSVNAKVAYNGVEVGRVDDIGLDPHDPSRVRLYLEIDVDTPIMTDTVASLAASGITGVMHIELSGGGPDSQPLRAAEGQEHPVIQTRPSLFARLDESLTGLIDDLSGTAEGLTEVANRVEMLLDEDNRNTITAILENVRAFTEDLDGITGEMETIAEAVAAATDELPALIAQADDTLAAFEDSALAIEGAGHDASTTLASLDASITEVADRINGVIDDLQPLTRGGPVRLVQLVDELQLLAATLRRLSQDVERNPEMLLFGRRDVVRGPGE